MQVWMRLVLLASAVLVAALFIKRDVPREPECLAKAFLLHIEYASSDDEKKQLLVAAAYLNTAEETGWDMCTILEYGLAQLPPSRTELVRSYVHDMSVPIDLLNNSQFARAFNLAGQFLSSEKADWPMGDYRNFSCVSRLLDWTGPRIYEPPSMLAYEMQQDGLVLVYEDPKNGDLFFCPS